MSGLNELVRIFMSLGCSWLKAQERSEAEYLYFEIRSEKQSIKQYCGVKWGNLFKVSSHTICSKLSTADAFYCASYCYCHVTQ